MAKSKKIEFQGDKFFKVLLAGLIVYDVPSIIEGVTGKAYSPLVQDLIGAGVGAAIGYMADDNTLFNASLAIAALDYLNGYISPELDKLTAGLGKTAGTLPAGGVKVNTQKTTQPALASYVNMPSNGLSEYVGNAQAGMISQFAQYRDAYRMN
jgi:hypothetical protein